MRFNPAKIAAAAAAVTVSAGIFAAAPAQSQTANFENLAKVAAQADTISCPDLKKQLDKTGRVNANTTRTDLVNMANAELASKPSLRIAAGPTINKVADRAVACGLVKSGNGGNGGNYGGGQQQGGGNFGGGNNYGGGSNQGGFSGNQSQSSAPQQSQQQSAPSNDPWNSAPQAGSYDGADAEPPF